MRITIHTAKQGFALHIATSRWYQVETDTFQPPRAVLKIGRRVWQWRSRSEVDANGSHHG